MFTSISNSKTILSLGLSLLLACFTNNILQAQSFGGHPTSVKWQSIDTDNVRVIFPKGQDARAFRIANIIDYMQANKLATIGNKTKKLDLVLQTNQVVSNGYVGLAPFRSEFFATPFQSNQLLGALDWLDVLSIHEYRHALQFTNANRGLTRFLHIFQGQNGWALGANLSIPDWFFEGDATMTETALSDAGRGRSPSFFKEQKALLLNGHDYSYMKARNGSYKDLLPNHYPLGYAMMNYARNKFDQNVWKDVVADAGRYRTIIYPFSGALKRHTGMRSPKMYREAYKELKEQWTKELSSIPLIDNQAITSKPKTVTDYKFPHLLNDGSIVCLVRSFKKTEAIYQIKDGDMKKLTSVGITQESFLSENNNRLAWTELKLDPRWDNRNYTAIITYDINTGKKRQLTNRSKLFSPQFSAAGNQIVAVQTDETLQTNLVLLNATSGEVIKKIENPQGDALSFPKWTTDDQHIIFVAKRQSKLAILKYNLAEGTTINLTDWNNHIIGSINAGKDRVVFNASFSGIDNIYSVGINGAKDIVQLTSVKIGAYMPDITPDGQSIVMSEFSDMGHMLSSLPLSKALNRSYTSVTPTQEMQTFNISLSPEEGDILAKIPDTQHEVKNYRGFLKGTKLHSWSFSGGVSTPQLSLSFANILNDFNAFVNVGYNRNEEVMQYGGNILYGKYYTLINLGTQFGGRSVDYLTPADTIASNVFSERNFNGGLSLPLKWVNGNFFTNLNLSANYIHHQISDNDDSSIKDFNFGSIQTSLSFSNIRRTAYQNLQSRFGQVLSVSYSKGIDLEKVEKVDAFAQLYLPGLAANHGILIEGAYQKELLSNPYQFLDGFNYARGYNYPLNDEVSLLSLNYQLPLFYPDWGFGGLTYFKRIRTNLFYDIGHSKLKANNSSTTQTSYGAELFFENQILNILPLEFGLRYASLPDALDGDDNWHFSIIINAGL